MAIIVDLNQVIYKSFFESVGTHTNTPADLVPMRNLTLDTLRIINARFRGTYGKMILASDSRTNWRKLAFPNYKVRRKLQRASGDVDWEVLHESMDTLREELIENFPYHYIQVRAAEADDIIGVLVKEISKTEEVLIISGDKDFRQLQRAGLVSQYDPVSKKFLAEADPELYLKNQILAGDPGDDIPNVLSPDDIFITEGVRQTSMTAGRKAALEGIQNRPDDKYYRNWKRNSLLIDLQNTPPAMREQILDIYKQGPKVTDRKKVLTYLKEKRLGNLQQHLSDF